MASAFITNALQVNFDSVLGISDNAEMELEQFFDTALVQDGDITYVVSDKYVAIPEDRFAGIFNLPTEGLTDLSTTKRAKGFVAQICVLLKSDPAVTLGEAKTFPPLNILSAKTVNTYVSTNKTIDARGETDELEVAKVAIVKNKSVSKKRSVSNAIKETAEFRMPAGSDDETVEKEPVVEEPILDQSAKTGKMMELETTAEIDDVDTIIEQILTDTASETPSSGCTRSPDEISTNGFSTSSWPETIFPAKTAAAAARGGDGGGGF
ncbi:Cytokinin oxidase [Dorcoceras hygrometricum]|uniref:Cytokinin oxidase n=1 Tax=Dorcoceras hygrometricum TaxID=472368 RepID=A0A2Z7CIN7_9LAMI|nr:Cytokinin oxidase [Dorcoceras hygrometricum]